METRKETWKFVLSPANPIWLFGPLSRLGHVLRGTQLLAATYKVWPVHSSRRGLWFLAPEVPGSDGPNHSSKGPCVTTAVPCNSALKPRFPNWGAGLPREAQACVKGGESFVPFLKEH